MAGPQWTPRIRRVSGNDQERLVYAISLMRERKFEEARDELKKLLDQNEQSLGATIALGMTYQALRKPEEALSCFRKAMEIDPKNAQAPLQAGFAALALGERENAAVFFATALDLDPAPSGAHLGLAFTLQKDEDPAQALEHAQAALRIDPALNVARILIAQLQKKTGNNAAAIQELETLLRRNPGQPMASVMLASLYSETNDDERALELLERTSKLRPDQAGIWSLQGRLRMKTGDYARAEAAFRQAAKLRPNDTFGPLRVVEALLPQGKLDEAWQMLQSVPRRGQAGAVAYKYYGDIYTAQESYEEAANSYHAALLKSKDGPATIAALEAELEGRNLKPQALVKKYQETIQKKMDEARERLMKRDFDSAARRLQPAHWQRGEAAHERLSA